jgi:hypothetical protein
MSKPIHQLDLPALDGANPLGFLAALGLLAVLTETNPQINLGWQTGARWTPFLNSPEPLDRQAVLRCLATGLHGQSVRGIAEKKRMASQHRFDLAKKKLKDAKDALKLRKLRGKLRDAEWNKSVAPLERRFERRRNILLGRLKEAVPSPELALGQRPDCTIEEFRQHARSMRAEAGLRVRATVDLLASFGTEISNNANERILPTPFCFITGSGHQWFLDTARELMAVATDSKLREALFERWKYTDEKLTMRWDPLDDRRYALMDRDPTASDNKSTTVWMANLLAYRALAFYSCAPGDSRLLATGWSGERALDLFTWPIWERALSADTIRSLLRHPAFAEIDLSTYRNEFRARGVAVVFRARRIQVGNPPLHKINFSPAYAL